MGLIAVGNNDTYRPAPEGTHMARCVQVIDLGTQYSQVYNNNRRLVQLVFELCSELNDAGSNFLLARKYTLSLGAKTSLRKDLESWRGKNFTEEELKGFDILNLLDKGCFLNVVHRKSEDGTRTYASIKAIMALPRWTEIPARETPLVSFLVEEWDDEVFKTLPEYTQDLIVDSQEYKDKHNPQKGPQPYYKENDDIPF